MRGRETEKLFSTHVEESRKEPPRSPRHRVHEWIRTVVQFIRYCVVGGVNTAIDVLVLNGLLWRFPTHSPIALTALNAIAYSCGAFSSFSLNKYWTFQRTHAPTVREVRRFLISVVIELVSSSVLVLTVGWILQPFITNPTLWANATKLVAVVIGVLISYSLMRYWTFAESPQKRQNKGAEHSSSVLTEPSTSREVVAPRGNTPVSRSDN